MNTTLSTSNMIGHILKGKFLKDTFMTNQTIRTDEIEMDIDPCNKDAIEKGHDTLPHKSSRRSQIYNSSQSDISCIISNEKRKDKDVKHITMTFRNIGDVVHKAEKQLLEFAENHVSNNTKYKNFTYKFNKIFVCL